MYGYRYSANGLIMLAYKTFIVLNSNYTML